MTTSSDYMADVYKQLTIEQLEQVTRNSSSCLRAKTQAHSYTVHGRNPLVDDKIAAVVAESRTEKTVIVIEGIKGHWIAALGKALSIDPLFFAQHAWTPPDGPSLWQTIFGSTPAEQKNPLMGHGLRGQSFWHIDGVLKCSHPTEEDAKNLNWLSRRSCNNSPYGPLVHTRISCYVRHDLPHSIYLFLVDASTTRSLLRAHEQQLSTQLHLPLALNRGGLALPPFVHWRIRSLGQSLRHFLSHSWHFDVLFTDATEALSPATFFHLLASSSWEHNLDSLDHDIRTVAFRDLRQPTVLINNKLHDLREELMYLRVQAAKTKKWITPAVNDELRSIQQKMSMSIQTSQDPLACTYIRQPIDALQEILVRSESLERFLMDSFHLLVSSTSVANAEISTAQARLGQRLTQLAFLYVPLSFVTGIFGMNIKEINGSPIPAWVVVVCLAVTAACTIAIFTTATKWQKMFHINDREAFAVGTHTKLSRSPDIEMVHSNDA